MSIVRRYLIAPSLVRLIRKERGGARITEGYFAPQAGRTSYVRIDGQDCHLVLITTDGEGRAKEERTEVPRAHGDALLDVCSGKAAYERTTIPLGGRDVQVDRYVTPPGLDIASVTFDDEAAAKSFIAPAWFGSDVSTEAGYDRHAVAINGVPASSEVGLSNAALNAVLDLIEPRFGFGGNALRRPAVTEVPAAVPPVPAPAPAPAPIAPPPPAPVAEAPAPEPVAPPPPPEAKAPEPVVETPPPAAPEAPKPAAPPAPVEMKPAAAAPEDKGDARIDDVIESLSQALSAAIQQPKAPATDDGLGSSFERWTVRPRRTNQQT